MAGKKKKQAGLQSLKENIFPSHEPYLHPHGPKVNHRTDPSTRRPST